MNQRVLLTIVLFANTILSFAQVQRIPLNLAPNQSFTLVKASKKGEQFNFIGRITTRQTDGRSDSLMEVTTGVDFTVTDRKAFLLSQNYGPSPDINQLIARYPDLFDKPGYTRGLPELQIDINNFNFKKPTHTFSVVPVSYNYNNLLFDYTSSKLDPVKTSLITQLGTNASEMTGSGSAYIDPEGNYSTIFGIYLDKGSDEGKQFKKYWFYKFSNRGAIENSDSVEFPIKRYLLGKNAVVNSKNEFRGVVYFFGPTTSTLKLKASDSTDLQYDMFYTNEKGKIVYHSTFQYGVKKFNLIPMAVTENAGKLRMVNQYISDSVEVLDFDASGKLTSRVASFVNKKRYISDKPTSRIFFDIFIPYEPVYNFTNKAGDTYWLIRRYARNRSELGVFAETNTYYNYVYFKVKQDNSFELLQSFDDNTGVSPANSIPALQTIQSNDEFCDILLKSVQNGEHIIWRMGNAFIRNVPNQIIAPATTNFSRDSYIKMSSNEYYKVGYSANEILLDKVVMAAIK